MKKSEKSSIKTNPSFFHLKNQTKVTKEEVLKTANKYMENFKYINFFAIACGVIVLADIIYKLIKNAFNEILPLIIIEVIMLAVIVFIWISDHENVKIKLGLRLMNFQLDSKKSDSELAKVEKEFVINDHSELMFFLNKNNKTWQYSALGQFSDVIQLSDIMHVSIMKQKELLYSSDNPFSVSLADASVLKHQLEIEVKVNKRELLYFQTSEENHLFEWICELSSLTV